MTNKRFFMSSLILIFISLLLLAIIVIVVDPFFQYHMSLPFLNYPMREPRYTNHNIIKKFDYDALITGTSMTANFKATEVDSLFATNSIKVPYTGASYKEINDALVLAVNSNEKLATVIRGLDYSSLLRPSDQMSYQDYPLYLYDSNYINDINYLLNKHTYFTGIIPVALETMFGQENVDFDAYCRWNDDHEFGKKAIMKIYSRPLKSPANENALTTSEKEIIAENVKKNVTLLATQNPNITFYYFYTPYSILYFDEQNQCSSLKKTLETGEYAAELILQCKNIKLFSFFSEYDLICDLNNYMDTSHYSADISSKILRWMAAEENMLTKSNYKEHFEEITRFYSEYNYDSLFA